MKKCQLTILLIFVLAFTSKAPIVMAESKVSFGTEVGYVKIVPVKKSAGLWNDQIVACCKIG